MMIHRKTARLLLTTVLSAFILAGCQADGVPALVTAPPTSNETSATYADLRGLPAPKRQVSVAVYSYPDLTGQYKPAETVATNSRAVTQGALWILVKALKDAGAGSWFKVTQRANLDNLLNERKIIRETQAINAQGSGSTPPSLPTLEMAGVILEGGIIGYDSNTVTGGIGARYLGIGGDTKYRQDTVTIYLNAISSQNGEILKSIMTRKTVASYGVQGSIFKFVSFQKLLEGEAGYTVNEPSHIAVTQAIEHAVRSLVIEGAVEGLWAFEDEAAGKEETQFYLADRSESDLLLGPVADLDNNKVLTTAQLEEIAARRREQSKRLAAQTMENREMKLSEERRKRDKMLLALKGDGGAGTGLETAGAPKVLAETSPSAAAQASTNVRRPASPLFAFAGKAGSTGTAPATRAPLARSPLFQVDPAARSRRAAEAPGAVRRVADGGKSLIAKPAAGNGPQQLVAETKTPVKVESVPVQAGEQVEPTRKVEAQTGSDRATISTQINSDVPLPAARPSDPIEETTTPVETPLQRPAPLPREANDADLLPTSSDARATPALDKLDRAKLRALLDTLLDSSEVGDPIRLQKINAEKPNGEGV